MVRIEGRDVVKYMKGEKEKGKEVKVGRNEGV